MWLFEIFVKEGIEYYSAFSSSVSRPNNSNESMDFGDVGTCHTLKGSKVVFLRILLNVGSKVCAKD